MKTNDRKKFLINPRFQISVIKQMVALTCVVLAIFYGANSYHFWSLKQQGLKIGLNPGHVFFKFVAEQRATMDLFFLVTSLLTLIAIVGFGMLLSHRVAGPLHRLKRYLDECVANDESLPLLKFRENDYFPEVADAVNLRLQKSPDASAPKT